MNRLARRLRAAAALAALVLLTSCSADAPGPSATPTPGQPTGPVRVARLAAIPDVHVPGSLELVAGTGTRFLVAAEPDADGLPGRYTPDNGRTWLDAPAELGLYGAGTRNEVYGSFVGYDGSFIGVRQAPEPDYSYTGFQRWDPDTGQVTSFDYDLDQEPPADGDFDVALTPIDYIGTLVLLNDSRIFDLSGSQAVPLQPRLPEVSGLGPVTWSGLTRGGQYAVGSADGADGRYLVVGALGAQGRPAAVKLPGLMAVDVSAERIHYLVATARELRVCRAETTAPESGTCVTLATGDFRSPVNIGELTTSDGADQVTLYRDDSNLTRRWFVRGSRATLVWSSKSQPITWQWLPFRDTTDPMALVRADPGMVAQAVVLADDGSAMPLFAAPAVPSQALEPAVTADRVVYRQQHVTDTGTTASHIWVRPLTGSGLGEETLLTDHDISQYFVSGDRTAVQWDRPEPDSPNDIVFYDQLTETGRIDPGSTTSGIRALSGPYARLAGKRAARQVVGVDGRGYDTGLVPAIFGSLVVEASTAKTEPGRTFAVRDLARPEAAPIPIELPDTAGRAYRDTDWRMWGDWVSATYEAFEGYPTVLFNYRTGQTAEFPREVQVLALGDGFALLADYAAGQVRLRLLATGEEIVVTDEDAVVTTDGVRTLAWSGTDGAQLARIEGLPAPVPRLLGALGASDFQADGQHSWTPQFDLTTPTGEGSLRLANSGGTVLAELPVAAAPGGSIRGISWDGRDDHGSLLPAGSYTWTLAVDGATSVDGQRPASGTLTVTR